MINIQILVGSDTKVIFMLVCEICPELWNKLVKIMVSLLFLLVWIHFNVIVLLQYSI